MTEPRRQEDVAEMMEADTRQTLGELTGIDIVTRFRREPPSFVIGYCISDEKTFLRVCDYIASRLKLPNDAIHDHDLNRAPPLNFLRELQNLQNPNLMVRMWNYSTTVLGDLSAHGYNQLIAQDLLSELRNNTEDYPAPKRTILIHHVDTKSEIGMDFVDFVYRFDAKNSGGNSR